MEISTMPGESLYTAISDNLGSAGTPVYERKDWQLLEAKLGTLEAQKRRLLEKRKSTALEAAYIHRASQLIGTIRI
jgi:hypothetical protein